MHGSPRYTPRRLCPVQQAKVVDLTLRGALRLLLCAFSLALISSPLGCSYLAYQTSDLKHAPTDWNPDKIQWYAYAQGMGEAARTRKPIVLIFYTDWCMHCHNYKKLFYDPEVVRVAQRFVMIRVERDSHPEFSAEYNIDGDYIPRTFFLTPAGQLLEQVHNGSREYRYFLDEFEVGELLELMSITEELVRAP